MIKKFFLGLKLPRLKTDCPLIVFLTIINGLYSLNIKLNRVGHSTAEAFDFYLNDKLISEDNIYG